MKKIQNILINCFLIIYILFSLILIGLVLVNNLNYIYLYVGLSLIFVFFIYFTKAKDIKISNKIFIPLLVIILVLYSFLLNGGYNVPTSDYQTFFENASSIALNNTFSNPKYIAVYPHLNGYIMTLGFLMKIFTTRYKVIILFNILSIFLGSFILYKLFVLENKNDLGKLGSLFWLYSPLNFMWTVVSIPICFFQTILLLSIYGLKKITMQKDSTKIYQWSIITGLIIGLANLYRPVMIIFIIAILIYYLLTYTKEKSVKVLIISLILIFLPYSIINKTNNFVIEKVSGYEVSGLPGWNVYVGSQGENGSWNESVGEVFEKYYYDAEFTPAKFHSNCLRIGFSNYQNRSLVSNIIFIKNKLSYLINGLEDLSTNLFKYFTNSSDNVRILLENLTVIWCWLGLVSSLFTMLYYKRKPNEFNLFLALLIIGLTIGHLFLEVSPRYFIPVYVPLLVLGLNFGNNLEKERRIKK